MGAIYVIASIYPEPSGDIFKRVAQMIYCMGVS